MLQHKRVDDNGGFGVEVECITVTVASVCGFASAEASLARRNTHEIVEMRRRRQRSGEGVCLEVHRRGVHGWSVFAVVWGGQRVWGVDGCVVPLRLRRRSIEGRGRDDCCWGKARRVSG